MHYSLFMKVMHGLFNFLHRQPFHLPISLTGACFHSRWHLISPFSLHHRDYASLHSKSLNSMWNKIQFSALLHFNRGSQHLFTDPELKCGFHCCARRPYCVNLTLDFEKVEAFAGSDFYFCLWNNCALQWCNGCVKCYESLLLFCKKPSSLQQVPNTVM